MPPAVGQGPWRKGDVGPALTAARLTSPRSPRPAERRASAAAASAALDKHLVERFGVYGLLRCAWDQVETDPFVDGWHLRLLGDHLVALFECRIRDLVVAMPPGLTKSLETCVIFPAYCWIRNPGFRLLTASSDPSVALRDAGKTKALVSSEWFQRRWGDRVRLDRDEDDEPGSRTRGRKKKQKRDRPDAIGIYYTTERGLRYSTSVGGRGVGWHVDLALMDDPLKPDEADSQASRDNAWDWWTKTASGRARDRATFRRLIQQQRLVKDDPAGRAVARGYVNLSLAQEYVPERRCVTVVGADPRRERGELICEARVPRAEVEKLKAEDPVTFAAQQQQDPQASGRKVWRAEWFRRYVRLPRTGLLHVCSWDLRTRGEDDLEDEAATARGTSYVAGSRWALAPSGELYLREERRGRWGFLTSVDEMRAQVLGDDLPDGRAHVLLVENKASGPSAVATLRAELEPLGVHVELVEPEGSKLARGRAAAAHLQARPARPAELGPRGEVLRREEPAVPGCALLPDGQAWVGDWLGEVEQYPAEPNDRGDCLAQVVLWSRSEQAEYVRALARL